MHARHRLRCLPLVVAALAAAAGCNSEPPRYAVTGTVKMDGAPVGLALVTLTPVDPNADPSGGGSARTDAAGYFSYGEEGGNTGLVAGEFKVTVSQTLIRGKPTLGGGGGKKAETEAGEKENVPELYRKADRTPLRATVSKADRAIAIEMTKK